MVMMLSRATFCSPVRNALLCPGMLLHRCLAATGILGIHLSWKMHGWAMDVPFQARGSCRVAVAWSTLGTNCHLCFSISKPLLIQEQISGCDQGAVKHEWLVLLTTPCSKAAIHCWVQEARPRYVLCRVLGVGACLVVGARACQGAQEGSGQMLILFPPSNFLCQLSHVCYPENKPDMASPEKF